MPNKNEQLRSLASFFTDDTVENLRREEEIKKLAAAKAAPKPPGTERPDFNDQPKTGLPTARPSAPLSPVRDVAAGVGNKNSNTEKAQPRTSGEGLPEYKRQNGVDAMDRSLKALAQPKTAPEPGVLDKAKDFISEVYEDQWAKPSRENKKAMAEIQAARDRNARKNK